MNNTEDNTGATESTVAIASIVEGTDFYKLLQHCANSTMDNDRDATTMNTRNIEEDKKKCGKGGHKK